MPSVSTLPNSINTQTTDHKKHKAAWGAMLAGTALSVYGWTRKSATGAALGVAGGAIALRAASAGPIADLVGTETTLRQSVIVMAKAADAYALWKDLRRIPEWMPEIKSVVRIDEKRIRWTRRHLGAEDHEWVTECGVDTPSQEITWTTTSSNDGNFAFSGRVEFKNLGEAGGTQVVLSVRQKMRTGLLHSAAVMVGQDPQHDLREALRRFKMLIEAGEIATTNGQPHGPRRLKGKLVATLLGEEMLAA